MDSPLVCLTLTGSTLKEDLETLNLYRNNVDVAELRVDFLTDEERMLARRFPQMAGLPCVLTIRRTIDGGRYEDGEASRTVLFARSLAFVEEDKSKNFAYVDFEEDFHVSSLRDAALAYGQKIIRSVHSMKEPITNIANRLRSLPLGENEIPKIAFMPKSLDDVTNLFKVAQELPDNNHILVAMGPLGETSRILSAKLNNYFTYTSPAETKNNLPDIGHLDPVTLSDVYHFRKFDKDTKLYGITGWPLASTYSPTIHNKGFESHGINALYVPIKAQTFSEALNFVNTLDLRGLSVTVPHKEAAVSEADFVDPVAQEIGASNTFIKNEDGAWRAYNTDASGFAKSLQEVVGKKTLLGKKVSIIGAGGAARAVAYAVKKMKGSACIFNYTDHFCGDGVYGTFFFSE